MKKYLVTVIILIISLSACKKQNEDFTTVALSGYFPLKVGKYITYNLDSTIFINFGSKDTVIKYQVKDTITAQIADNNGRAAFRIIRYIRKDSTASWAPDNTFMAIPTATAVEYVENNFRFIKLVSPIKQGYKWKGNSYIETNTNFQYLDDWNYTYDKIDAPLLLNGVLVNNTITVLQRDQYSGQDPKLTSTQFAEKNYGIEQYGKNIGLVYKEFLHWEYQGNQSSIPGFTGYGVKLSMIDHN